MRRARRWMVGVAVALSALVLLGAAIEALVRARRPQPDGRILDELRSRLNVVAEFEETSPTDQYVIRYLAVRPATTRRTDSVPEVVETLRRLGWRIEGTPTSDVLSAAKSGHSIYIWRTTDTDSKMVVLRRLKEKGVSPSDIVLEVIGDS